MSARKLWKVISISKAKGSRISRSMTYGDCLELYNEYRKELSDGDTLYMMQVLEVAVGRATISATEEITVPDVGSGAFDNLRKVS